MDILVEICIFCDFESFLASLGIYETVAHIRVHEEIVVRITLNWSIFIKSSFVSPIFAKKFCRKFSFIKSIFVTLLARPNLVNFGNSMRAKIL